MTANAILIPNDMSDLCRVCLQLPDESQYLDLTTTYDEEDNLTYAECFTICTQIDLSAGESVPHHLCKPCGIELQMAYDFHKKIEESKRVIEQCQKHLKIQLSKDKNLLPNNERLEVFNVNEPGKTSKYVISTDEVQTSVISEVAHETQTKTESHFVEPSDANEESDGVEIVELKYQVPSDHTLSNADINESFEDHFEIEALEDEATETETLQIRVRKNTNVQSYKSLESEEKMEFVEYAEDLNGKNATSELNREELNAEFLNESDENDTDDKLAWQDNVVAVANKEHLHVVIEGEEEETATAKSNFTANDSSQDEAMESLSAEVSEVKEYSEKNTTERKRHVGSYSCDYCHRVYPNYSRMKTHRRCHEADRPKFSCTQCGRLYATKQARDCHIQTVHEKSGYVCSICDKVFAIRKSLEVHMRYHTGDFPFACNLCDRKFAQASHLTTHINVRHNQIRFSCEYPNCGKFFTSSSSLRNHEYTHSIMPFECEYCEQGYPAKSRLRLHIKRKHGMSMTNDDLEKMRVFHIMRSKVNLVQFVDS